MGGCLASRPDQISSPSRVSRVTPDIVPPTNQRENTNIYKSASSSPSKVDVIYTDDTRRKLSLASKVKGNEHFNNKEYLLAAEAYTKAIKIYDKDSVYFSNRALCYAFLAKFDEALADAESGIQLDPKNYKAYHVKGTTLVEIGKKEESIEKMKEGAASLEKCLNMIKESQGSKKVIMQVEGKLGRANKIVYLKEQEAIRQKQEQTRLLFERLISQDKGITEEQKKATKELMNLFINQREDHKVQEIPESLSCKITFDFMAEPVISPSGISYEKEALMGHLMKVGLSDPFTRQPVRPDELVANNQLVQCIKEFQVKNPWSFEFISPNEDYHAISL